MQKNSLIKLLKAFSKKELQDFGEFINSPYFNKKKSVIDLFNILHKFYPDFNDEALMKENIHKKMFPGKTYSDSNFRVLVHNLNELARKFCAYRSFENNKTDFKYKELLGLMNKQQFQYLDKMILKLIKDLDSDELNANEYYYSKFRIEYENLFFLTVTHASVFEKFLHKLDFEKTFDDLTSFYIIITLRLYINILNIQIIYKKEFKTDHFERMLSLIDNEIFKENPYTELYFYVMKMLKGNEQYKYYLKTREKLKVLKNKLNADDLNEIYINLTNYCNRCIAAGKNEFLKEKFDIYKEESESKAYFLNGFVTPVYYKNRIRLGLDLKEFKWVREFIENFKDKLHTDSKSNVYLYNLALYEFETSNFTKSLELLSGIKFDELYMKFDTKVLQIMIYYELNSDDSLDFSMEAFRHFLINNKLLPENKKESYSNFHKFLNKLIQFKNKKDQSELERLKNLMSDDLKILNKVWIEKKINEILNI